MWRDVDGSGANDTGDDDDDDVVVIDAGGADDDAVVNVNNIDAGPESVPGALMLL